MKKISIVCFTGLLFFTACENTGSSTVGSWEKEETTQSSEKNESEGHEEQAKEKIESAATDSLNTSTSPSVQGANTKADTTVSADSLK